MKTVRVVVYHGGYGCDTGCCGHWVLLADDESRVGEFTFDHPWNCDKREWAIEFAQEQVRRQFGEEHVADLDWDNSIVVDDD